MHCMRAKGTEFMASGGYPRLLLVSARPVSAVEATGATVSRLLLGWPKERVAELCCTSSLCDGRSSVAERFLALGPGCTPVDWLFRSVLKCAAPGLVQGAPSHPMVTLPRASRGNARARVHMHARALADISPLVLPAKLRKWVATFRPDVVYSPAGRVRLLKLVNAVASFGGCPAVIHFLDDWPGVMYTDGQCAGLARWILGQQVRRALRSAGGGFCIGEDMAEEYTRRYGGQYESFMNCVDRGWFESGTLTSGDRQTSALRFLYTGGLHLGRDYVLSRILQALSALHREGERIEFSVCTPAIDVERGRALVAGFPFATATTLSPGEVMGEVRKCDVVIHVESFEPHFAKFTRLSVSTKIPEYLAAGKPVLAVGPECLASMRHLQLSQGAIRVVAPDGLALLAATRELLNAACRALLGANGRKFAMQHHEAHRVRERFRLALKARCELYRPDER